MSPSLGARLDFESKLDRSPELIDELIADGRRQAGRFLRERAEVARAG